MKSRLLLTLVLLMFLMCAPAHAANITGTITAANTAVPLKNGTLTFTLSQAGIISGSYALTTSPVSCYTSTDGTVVGLPNPIVAPTSSVVAGSIPAGTYAVKITYYGPGVETLASPAQIVILASTNGIQVTAPMLQPSGASGFKVYIGVPGSETLQATVTGFVNPTITSLSAGSALPSSNTSTCSLAFNDTIIPSGTTYKVNALDQGARQVPGFPQQWYLAGSTVNVANGYPIAQNPQVRFPLPVLTTPSSQATQSVNSPLTLNGYALTTGRLDVPGATAPATAPSGQGRCYFDSSSLKFRCSENNGAYVDLIGGSGVTCSGCTANLIVKYNGSALVNSSLTDTGTNVTVAPSAAVILNPGTRVIYGQASTDLGLNMVGNASFGLVSATTSASTLEFTVTGGLSTQIKSGISGSGSYLPLVWNVNNGEAGRWYIVPSTGERNMQIGSGFTSSASQPLVVRRDQNASSDLNSQNLNAGTSARATVRMSSDNGDLYVYAASTAYNAVSGYAGRAVISSGLTNGLVIQTGNTSTGDILFQPGGLVTKVTIAANTGNITAPALTLTTPLAQTSGGTGATSTITSGQIVYSNGTSYVGNGALTITFGGNRLQFNGRVQATGASTSTLGTPPVDSGSIMMYYNSTTDNGSLLSSTHDGAGGGVTKPMYLGASEIVFLTGGSPAALAGTFSVTTNGPKWYLAGTTGTATPTWGTNLPNGLSQVTPKTWLKVETTIGTGWIPFFQ